MLTGNGKTRVGVVLRTRPCALGRQVPVPRTAKRAGQTGFAGICKEVRADSWTFVEGTQQREVRTRQQRFGYASFHRKEVPVTDSGNERTTDHTQRRTDRKDQEAREGEQGNAGQNATRPAQPFHKLALHREEARRAPRIREEAPVRS